MNVNQKLINIKERIEERSKDIRSHTRSILARSSILTKCRSSLHVRSRSSRSSYVDLDLDLKEHSR